MNKLTGIKENKNQIKDLCLKQKNIKYLILFYNFSQNPLIIKYITKILIIGKKIFYII